MKLTIDPEFKAKIPPLSSEEYAQLESNLKAEGCRDPLVTWDGILIDGHNRHEICTKHGIAFLQIQRDFADRSEAVEWIIRNQFGRRNLDPYQRTKLALQLEQTIKERAKANVIAGGSHGGKGPQNSANPCSPIETREEIAKLAGVSRDTVDKVKQIEKSATPEIKDALAKGEISINKAHATTKKPVVEEEPETVVVDGVSKEAPKRRTPNYIPSDALDIWNVAKTHLDRILKNDIHREQALNEVIAYCQNRISNKK